MNLTKIIFFNILIFFNLNCFNKFEFINENLKKIENNKINYLIGLRPLFSGCKDAIFDNIKNIWNSLLYPIDSMVKIFRFCKKILSNFFYFIMNPKPDYFYINYLENKTEAFINFITHMNLSEKYRWIAYIITDFIIGYIAPFGLGWKSVSLARNIFLSVKSFKYINSFYKLSYLEPKFFKIINSSNNIELLNVKYGFEYVDQFRQYLNDLARHESC